MPPLMKSRGVPSQLRETIPQGMKPARAGDAIPPAFQSTIKSAEGLGEESTQEGAEGTDSPLNPPSNGALGAISSLIAPPGFNVP